MGTVYLEQGSKAYGFADLHGRRKKEKEKKKIHPYNGIEITKRDITNEKNFFKKLCPLFHFFAHYKSERCNTNRAEQHLVKQKGDEKLPSPKTQAVTQKELHAIADEAIGNAKKIYIHYTPLEGAMVIRLLF